MSMQSRDFNGDTVMTTKTQETIEAGTPMRGGGFFFQKVDVNDCRSWLRAHGLECDITGWHGNGQIGTLTWDSTEGSHVATRSPWPESRA
jgi:hypothetical protein